MGWQSCCGAPPVGISGVGSSCVCDRSGLTPACIASVSVLRAPWYLIDRLPLNRMWADATYWLPLVVLGGRLQADITYTSGNRTTIDHAHLAPLGEHDAPVSRGSRHTTAPVT
jgi:hypothetical protein